MGRRIALRSMANGKLVTAENAGNEPLIANRDAIGPWETFEEIVVDSGAPEPAPEPSPPQPVPLGAKWRGSSDFRLLQRFLTDEDIDGVLQERLDAGANIIRVFGMKQNNTGWELNPKQRPDFHSDVRRFLDHINGRIRVYFTVFADTAAMMPDQAAQLGFFDYVIDAIRPYVGFVAVELCNEWNHPTQRIDPRAFRKPDGIICSRGSAMTDQDPASPYWDIAGYSARRNVPPDARGFTNYNPFVFQAEYPMRVPKFAQEGMKPEDYGGNPDIAALMGEHATVGIGGFFHSNGGVDSRPFSGTERACAEAFFRAV